jgi:hypothetical protein
VVLEHLSGNMRCTLFTLKAFGVDIRGLTPTHTQDVLSTLRREGFTWDILPDNTNLVGRPLLKVLEQLPPGDYVIGTREHSMAFRYNRYLYDTEQGSMNRRVEEVFRISK